MYTENTLSRPLAPRIRNPRIGVAVLGLVALPVLAQPAAADTKWTQRKGLTIGAELQWSMIRTESPTPMADDLPTRLEEVGPGGSLRIGYTFVPSFAVRVAASASRHLPESDEIEGGLGSLLLEAQFRLLPHQRVQPYFLVGLGASAVAIETDAYRSAATGGTGALGFGFTYKFTRAFAFDVNTRLDFTSWNEAEVTQKLGDTEIVQKDEPITEEGFAARVGLGLVVEF